MPTVSEVHDTFTDLISRQKKVIDALRSEERAVKNDLNEGDRALAAAIEAFMPAPEREQLEALTAVAARAGTPYDFVKIVEGALDINREVEAKLADLQKRYGAPQAVERRVEEMEMAYGRAAVALDGRERIVAVLDGRMRAIDSHDRQYGCAITPDNAAAYERFRLWSFLADGEYRHGRQVLRAYRQAGHDFVSDCRERAAAEQERARLEAALREQAAPLQEWQGARNAARDLQAAYKSFEDIQGEIRAVLHKALTTDDAFGHAFAAAFAGDGRAADVGLALVRLASLDKVAIGLEEALARNQQMLDRLEQPMSKLGKGVRNRPWKDVDMDLDGLVRGVTAQQALAAYKTVSAEKARSGIRSFTPDAPIAPTASAPDNGLYVMQGMMLMWLLTAHGVDGAYAQGTFGIDAAGAQALSPDIDTQGWDAPDIAGVLSDAAAGAALEGLDAQGMQDLSAVDPAAFDSGAIDSATRDVDMGMPSVDMGMSDFGTTDFGTTDYGTSDLGGGFSGGGFD